MKKQLFTLLLLIFPLFSLFAIPGVDSYIQDESGEYVYYRDYSFNRESYIGILYYDEATYQVKYFAPKDEEQFLPEKEISILMTVNPEATYWEMTGERIISTILPNTEDTDLVNYLHDIMYELSARRKHVDVTKEEVSVQEDYSQFGGNVTLTYNAGIPIFNLIGISKIDDADHGQFDLATVGQLRNSDDKSFENFKGFPKAEKYELNEKQDKKAKKAKTSKKSFELMEFKIDSTWTQAMDNMWLCGNDAIITCSSIPRFFDDLEQNQIYLLRKLMESMDSIYVDYQVCSILPAPKSSNSDLIIYSESYSPIDGKVTVSQKILKLNEYNNFDLFIFTAYKKSYKELQGYYMNIINSYKHK